MGNALFARFFDRFAGKDEERGQADLRRELLSGLSGLVVEIGPGNGLNFPHYPSTVRAVIAVEPQPHLRRRAADTARGAPAGISVVGGSADRIPLPDSVADAAVVSGVLCSVPDQRAALAELRRVLVPGGQLRFYEHVRGTRLFGRYQDAVDPVWSRLMGGCRANRDTRVAIERSGYRIEVSRDLRFPPGARFSPVAPRIIGVARRR